MHEPSTKPGGIDREPPADACRIDFFSHAFRHKFQSYRPCHQSARGYRAIYEQQNIPIMIETKNLGYLYDSKFGGDIALIDCRDWERPREYTHGQIEAAANACARGLLKRGLRRGDSVALLAANRAEFLISYLGILRAGLIAVPFNYQFPPDTVDFILRDADVAHVICDGARVDRLSTSVGVTNFDDAGASGF